MSKSENPNYVGKNHPPREHRFSASNQPRRRRSKKPKLDFAEDIFGELADALSQHITITQGGQRRKIPAGRVLVQQLVNQGLKGSYDDKLKLTTFLQKSGTWDLFKSREEIEKRHEEALDRHRQEQNELLACACQAARMSAAFLIDLQRITGEFVELLETGSCAASGDPVAIKANAEFHAFLNGALWEYTAATKQVWASDSYPFDRHWAAAVEDEADEVSPSPAGDLKSRSAPLAHTDASPPKIANADQPLDDDFYTGQIGKD